MSNVKITTASGKVHELDQSTFDRDYLRIADGSPGARVWMYKADGKAYTVPVEKAHGWTKKGLSFEKPVVKKNTSADASTNASTSAAAPKQTTTPKTAPEKEEEDEGILSKAAKAVKGWFGSDSDASEGAKKEEKAAPKSGANAVGGMTGKVMQGLNMKASGRPTANAVGTVAGGSTSAQKAQTGMAEKGGMSAEERAMFMQGAEDVKAEAAGTVERGNRAVKGTLAAAEKPFEVGNTNFVTQKKNDMVGDAVGRGVSRTIEEEKYKAAEGYVPEAMRAVHGDISNSIGSAFDSVIKEASDRFNAKLQQGFGGTSIEDVFGGDQQANRDFWKETSPEQMQKIVDDVNINGIASRALYKGDTGNYQDWVVNGAKNAKMDVDKYVRYVAMPSIARTAQAELEKKVEGRYKVKNYTDYFVKKMATGLMTADAMGANQYQMMQKGVTDYEQDLNWFGKAGGFVGTGIGDAPLMMAGGAVGGLTLKGVAAGLKMAGARLALNKVAPGVASKVLTRAGETLAPSVIEKGGGRMAHWYERAALANLTKPQWYAQKLSQGVISGSANMGTFEGLSAMRDHVSYGDDMSGAALLGAFVLGAKTTDEEGNEVRQGGFLHGARTGAALGAVTPLGHYMSGVSNTALKSMAATVGSKAMEAALFTGLDYLSADEKDKANFSFADKFLDNSAMIVGFAFSGNPGGFIKGAYRGTLAGIKGIAHPADAWRALNRDNGGVRGYALSDDHKEYMKKLFPNSTIFSLLDHRISMDGREGAAEREFQAIFNNPQLVPWTVRQKIGGGVFGVIEPVRPLTDRIEVGNGWLKMYAKDGELIDVARFNNADELSAAIDADRIQRTHSAAQNVFAQYEFKNLSEDIKKKYTDTFNAVAERNGMKGNDLTALLLRNDPLHMNDNERTAVKDFLASIKDVDKEVNDGIASPEQSAENGFEAADNDNLVDPNTDGGALADIAARVKETQEAYLAAQSRAEELLDRKNVDKNNAISEENIGLMVNNGLITTDEAKVLFEAIKARNNYENAMDTHAAYVKHTADLINQAVEGEFARVAHKGKVAGVESEGDVYVMAQDKDGNVFYVIDGDVENGGVRSESDMVIVVDGEGNIDYKSPDELMNAQAYDKMGYVGERVRLMQEDISERFPELMLDSEGNFVERAAEPQGTGQMPQGGEVPPADAGGTVVETPAERIKKATGFDIENYVKLRPDSYDVSTNTVGGPAEGESYQRAMGLIKQLLEKNPNISNEQLLTFIRRQGLMFKMNGLNFIYAAKDAIARGEMSVDDFMLMFEGIESVPEGGEVPAYDKEAVALELGNATLVRNADGSLQNYRAVRDMLRQKFGMDIETAEMALDEWLGENKPQAPTRPETVFGEVPESVPEEEREVFDQKRKQYDVNKTVGGETFIYLPNGEKITGHYVLHEAGDVMPSHDPLNGFKQTEGIPRKADGRTNNDRDYESDKDAQQAVGLHAQTYRMPGELPVLSRDGVVLSGNDRSQARMLAAENGTDAKYLEELGVKAGEYGFSAEDVARYKHPTVSFEMDGDVQYDTKTYAKFNENDKKRMNSAESQAKYAKLLEESPVQVATICTEVKKFDNVDKLFEKADSCTKMFEALERAGIWSSMDRVNYLDEEGYFTDLGEMEFKNVLLGLALSDDMIRFINKGAMKGVKKTVVGSIPLVVESMKLGKYNLEKVFDGAVRAVVDAMSNGKQHEDNIWEYFNREADMGGEMTEQQRTVLEAVDAEGNPIYSKDERVLALLIADAIVKSKARGISKFLSNMLDEYNKLARDFVSIDETTGKAKEDNTIFGNPEAEDILAKSVKDTLADVDARLADAEDSLAKLLNEKNPKNKKNHAKKIESTKREIADLRNLKRAVEAITGKSNDAGLPEGNGGNGGGRELNEHEQYINDNPLTEDEIDKLAGEDKDIARNAKLYLGGKWNDFTKADYMELVERKKELGEGGGEKNKYKLNVDELSPKRVRQYEETAEGLDDVDSMKGVERGLFKQRAIAEDENASDEARDKAEELIDKYELLLGIREEMGEERTKAKDLDEDMMLPRYRELYKIASNYRETAERRREASAEMQAITEEHLKRQMDKGELFRPSEDEMALLPKEERERLERYHEDGEDIDLVEIAVGKSGFEHAPSDNDMKNAIRELRKRLREDLTDTERKSLEGVKDRLMDILNLREKARDLKAEADRKANEKPKTPPTPPANAGGTGAGTGNGGGRAAGNGGTGGGKKGGAVGGGKKGGFNPTAETEAAMNGLDAALDGLNFDNVETTRLSSFDDGRLSSVRDHLDTREARNKFRAFTKVATDAGYQLIKAGLYDKDNWKDYLTQRVGEKAKAKLDMTDAEWDEYLEDIWNQNPYGEEGKTLAEWAEHYKNLANDGNDEVPTEGTGEGDGSPDGQEGGNDGTESPTTDGEGNNNGTGGAPGTEGGTSGGSGGRGSGNGTDVPPDPSNPGGTGGGEGGQSPVGGTGGGSAKPSGAPGHTEPTDGGNGGTDNSGQPVGGTGGGNTNTPSGQVRTDEVALRKDGKVLYKSKSGGNPMKNPTVAPKEIMEAMTRTLESIGDVDEYVREALGFDSKEKVYQGLSSEQIDGVAMGIWNMRNGHAMINADQTGLGKGRQVAALLQYGIKQGLKPVLITESDKLYKDNYRDMVDIGLEGLTPFIIASNKAEAEFAYENADDPSKNRYFSLPSKEEMDEFLATGKIPEGYDYVVTSYHQIAPNETTDNRGIDDSSEGVREKDLNLEGRRKAVAQLCKNNIVVFDEAHKAAGAGGTSRFCKQILRDARGAACFSATYAKRPENMAFYALRSVLQDAHVSEDDLIAAIKKGGPVFQEILAKELAESGGLIRRERDMTGVTVDWEPTQLGAKEQREKYDSFIGEFREITRWQNAIAKKVQQAMAKMHPGAKIGVRFRSNNAALFNITNQLYTSLKVQDTIRRAIEMLEEEVEVEVNGKKEKRRQKVFIPLHDVCDALIKDSFVQGDVMRKNDLSVALERRLKKSAIFNVDIRIGNGVSTTVEVDASEMFPSEFRQAMARLENYESGLSVSPVDALKEGLREAGYKVEEITGRESSVDRQADGTYILTKRKAPKKNDIIDSYNKGELDVVILNESGSTGSSLHASEKFADQRVRHSLTIQAMLDVAQEMQIRGRVDRSGQLYHAIYSYLVSAVPAENRLMMMLKAKLKSLDAQTTASQKSEYSSVDVADITNKYGSQVIVDLLKDEPDWVDLLGDPFGWRTKADQGASYVAKERDFDVVLKRLPLLLCSEQEDFYNKVSARYNDKIEELNAAGMNDLEMANMPLDAETKNIGQVIDGEVPGGNNTFADSTYIEEVEANNLDRPYNKQELEGVITKTLKDKDAKTYNDDIMTDIDKFYGEKNEKFKKQAQTKFERDVEFMRKHLDQEQKKRKDTDNPLTDEEKAAKLQAYTDEQAKYRDDQIHHNEMVNSIASGTFRQVMSRAQIGDYVKGVRRVSDSTRSFEGVVVGFEVSKSKGVDNSYMLIASTRGTKQIKIPFSDSAAINSLTNGSLFDDDLTSDPVKNWDSIAKMGDEREKRYIYTGNLLMALAQGRSGQIAKYTTSDGETKQGIVLPKGTALSSVGKREPLSKAIDRIQKLELNGKLVSSDKRFTIIKKKEGRSRWSSSYSYQLVFRDNKENRETVCKDKRLAALCGMSVNVGEGGHFGKPKSGAYTVEMPLRKDEIQLILDHLTDTYHAEYDAAVDFGKQAAENNLPGITRNNAYNALTARDCFEKLARPNGDKKMDDDILDLAEKVFDLAENLGVKYSFGTTKREVKNGYVSTELGYYNPSKNELRLRWNSTMYGDRHRAAQTMLHETIHVLTSYAIMARKQGKTMSKELAEAVDELVAVHKTIVDAGLMSEEYGINNTYNGTGWGLETVAEMANPIFRAKLKAIKLYDKVVGAVRDVIQALWKDLKMPEKDETAFDRVEKALNSMLDNFDEKLFHEINGKNQNWDGEEGVLSRWETKSVEERDKEYEDAVRSGDKEKAMEMLRDEADRKLNTMILPNDDDVEGFKYHRGAAPKKTFKRYAVLNVTPDGFKAAYAGNGTGTPIGVWLDAQNLQAYMSDKVQFADGTFATYIKGDTGASAASKFSKEKMKEYGIKGSDRMLLERGGKHSSDVPNFSQMNVYTNEAGEKVKSAKEGALPHNKLIFEIEYGMSEDGDLSEQVKVDGRIDKAGKNQGYAKIQPNQYYDFKTNPNAVGKWGIGGTFRITRLVPHDEVVSVTENYKKEAVAEAERAYKAGEISKKDYDAQVRNANAIQVQKWVGGYHPEDFGLSAKGVEEMRKEGEKQKVMDITYDDNGKLIPLSERFDDKKDDLRYRTGEGKPRSTTSDEVSRIVEKAKADGTYMKAPNGKPSKLNEKQWAQTRTAAFKEWFGDWENDPENASKAVDENGEPLVVYHSSNADFDKFEQQSDGWSNTGVFWFSVNEKYSKNYGDKTKGFFLNVRNVSDIGDIEVPMTPDNMRDLRWSLGVGSLEDKDGYDPSDEYYQIKTELEENYAAMEDEMPWREVPSRDEIEKEAEESVSNISTYTNSESFRELLVENGIEGVMAMEGNPVSIKFGGKEIKDKQYRSFGIVDAKNIKSATDNNGEFNGRDERFTHRTADAEVSVKKREMPGVVRKAAAAAIEALGGGGHVHKSYDMLPEEGKEALRKNPNAMGWYNTKTGKVHIYLPNCPTAYEAERTVLHEKVGHEGLRKVVGEKEYNKFLMSVWEGVGSDARHEIAELASKMGHDYYKAVDEWLAQRAEDFDLKGDAVKRSTWQKIKDVWNQMLHKLGFKHGMSEKDIREALWLSRHSFDNKPGNMDYTIRKAAFKGKLERYQPSERISKDGRYWGEGAKNETDLFRTMSGEDREKIEEGLTPQGKVARDWYEDALKHVSYLWTEAFQNNGRALQQAYKAVLGVGKRVAPDQDCFALLNQLGSRNQQGLRAFSRDYAEPITRTVGRAMTCFDGGSTRERYQNLEHYVYAKHALERNRVLAVRDKLKALAATPDKKGATETNKDKAERLQGEFDDLRDSLKGSLDSGSITLRDYYAQLDAFILKEVDGKWDAGKHDVSGISDTEFFSFGTGTKGEYDDAAVIEHVMNTEARMGEDMTEELWDGIGRTAQFVRNNDYESGFHNSRVEKRMEKMFSWYVPLRGFSADTAEDMYYYMHDKGNHVGKVAMKAEGRVSASDSPIETLLAMGCSSIMRGNRNRAKQALVRFVRNNPNNLLTEMKTYYEEKTDAMGNTTLTALYPDFKEGMTAKDVEQAIADFEADIAARKAAGDKIVFLTDKKTGTPYRIIRDRNKEQHFAHAWINGKDVTIILHGNPRAMQFVNGQISNYRMPVLSAINSLESQLATSKSLTFMARNSIRDYNYATSSLLATESLSYNKDFQKMYWSLSGKNVLNLLPGMVTGVYDIAKRAVVRSVDGKFAEPIVEKHGVVNSMKNLFVKYKNGTLDMSNETERYFKEFCENGGMTGYTQLQGVDEWKEEINGVLEEAYGAKGWKGFKQKAGKYANYALLGTPKMIGTVVKAYFKLVDSVNEAAENQARFSCYYASRKANRKITRAIDDAKRVSVNFNLTGAGSATMKMKNMGGVSGFYKANAITAGLSATVLKNTMWFFNAGVQGMSRTYQIAMGKGAEESSFVKGLGKAAKTKQFYKAMGTFAAWSFGWGFAMPILNELMAAAVDDDDDRKKYGKNPYCQLPEYVRRDNFCMYIGHGRFVMMPWAIETRAMYAQGDLASAMTMYPEMVGDRPIMEQMVMNMAQMTPVDIFGGSKVGSNDLKGGVTAVVTPDVLEGVIAAGVPGVAEGTNVGWTGTPISYVSDRNKKDPKWKHANPKTPSGFVNFAKWANKQSGGDDVTPGRVNLDPSKLEYLFNTYGSGPAKDVNEFINLIANSVEEDGKVEGGKVPVLKAVYRNASAANSMNVDRSRWYAYRKEYEDISAHEKTYKRAGRDVDTSARLAAGDPKLKIARIVDRYKKKIKKLETKKNKASTRADRELYQDMINERIHDAIVQIDMIERGGKKTKP